MRAPITTLLLTLTVLLLVGSGPATALTHRGEVKTPPAKPSAPAATTITLAAPTLVAPADAATLTAFSADLSWQAVTSATCYSVEIATKDDFSAGSASAVVNGLTVTTPRLKAATTYYWRVKADAVVFAPRGLCQEAGECCGGGHEPKCGPPPGPAIVEGPWSTVWSFTTGAAPTPPTPVTPTTLAAPILLAPADTSTGLPLNVDLSWQAVSSATAYTVQLATQSDFSTGSRSADVTSTTITTPQLTANTTYYWRVKALGVSSATGAKPTGDNDRDRHERKGCCGEKAEVKTAVHKVTENCEREGCGHREPPCPPCPHGPPPPPATPPTTPVAIESPWSTVWSFTTGDVPVVVPPISNAAYGVDLSIRSMADKTSVGVGVIDTTGTQADQCWVAQNATATFNITVNNIGNTADTFVLSCLPGSTYYTVKYLDNETDITSAINGQGWTTPTVAAGASYTIQITVTPLTNRVDPLALLVTATSIGDTTKADAVKAVTAVSH